MVAELNVGFVPYDWALAFALFYLSQEAILRKKQVLEHTCYDG